MILSEGNSIEVQEDTMKATVHETGEGIKTRTPYVQGLSEVFKNFMKEHSQPGKVVEPEATPPGRTPSFLGTDAEHVVMPTPPRPD